MPKIILELNTAEEVNALRQILHITCLAKGMEAARACVAFDDRIVAALQVASAPDGLAALPADDAKPLRNGHDAPAQPSAAA